MRCRLLLSFVCSCYWGASLSAQEVVYVAVAKTSLLSEASNTASPVVTVALGTKLNLVSKKGLWCQVSDGNQTAWLHQMYISEKHPSEKDSGFINIFNRVVNRLKDRDTEVRKRATVMGIRGLDEASQAEDVAIEPNYDAVDDLDDSYRKYTDKELDAFITKNEIPAKLNKSLIKSEQTSLKLKSDEVKTEEVEQEIQLGRTIAGKLIAAFGLFGNAEVQRYINLLGQSIARYSEASDQRFVFAVLNTSHVNAYATPSGYIFVTRGALNQVSSEAELVAILGHEIAHVSKKHVYNAVKNLQISNQELSEENKIRMRPSDQADSQADVNKIVSRVVGVKGTATIALFKAMVNKAYEILVIEGINHQYEYQADEWGVVYALRVGYSARALQSYLERLGKLKGAKESVRLTKTHPPLTSRIEKLSLLSKDFPSDSEKTSTETKRYQRVAKLTAIPTSK